MKKEKVDKKILNLTELGVLLAIIIIMAFTPIGYLKFGVVEITLITVPVIVGAIVLDPKSSALLGFVFGLTSFLQCVFGMSAFGVALLEINPFFCFLVCVPTRTLMGWCTGLVFKLIKYDSGFEYGLTGVIGSLFNTIFFLSTLCLLYWRTDYIQGIARTLGVRDVISFLVMFAGINGFVELVCCSVLSAVICTALHKWFKS